MDSMLMLQEYIGPRPATTPRWLSIDRDGRILAAFARRRLRMKPFRFGTALHGQRAGSRRWGRVPPLEGLLTGAPLSRHLQRGVQAKIRDGAFKAARPDARPVVHRVRVQCGMNMPRLADRTHSASPGRDPDYRAGRRCVFIQRDWGASRRLFKAGQLSRARGVRDWLWSEKAIRPGTIPLPASGIRDARLSQGGPCPSASGNLREAACPGRTPSEALHARRSTGRSLLAQCGDLLRLRMSPIRLRSAEYSIFASTTPAIPWRIGAPLRRGNEEGDPPGGSTTRRGKS